MFFFYFRKTYDKLLDEAQQNIVKGELKNAEDRYAAALHEVYLNDCQLQSIECLEGLAQVYLEYGKRSSNGEHFTKSIALLNAALRRCDITECCEGKHDSIWSTIKEVEKTFMEKVLKMSHPIKLIERDSDEVYRQLLSNLRKKIGQELEKIDTDDKLHIDKTS